MFLEYRQHQKRQLDFGAEDSGKSEPTLSSIFIILLIQRMHTAEVVACVLLFKHLPLHTQPIY